MAAGTDLSGSRRSPTKTAAYVYGVARHVPRIRRTGVMGADVDAIEHAGLTAIVSPVGSVDVRAKRQDLVAHQDVLQAVFAEGPVVPLRFGTVFDDAATVVSELLAPRRDVLLRLLARFEGVAELTVRARYVEDAVLEEIVRDDARVARLRGGSATVALGEAVAHALEAKRRADAADIERGLGHLAEDVALDEPRTEYELFRGAFLVPRDAIPTFDAEMNVLARRHEGRIVFKYVGPLPPHSFVDEAVAA